MSAIIKHFEVSISRKDAERIHEEWSKHGSDSGAMLIMQPIDHWGPFRVKNVKLNCAILDVECAQAMMRAMEEHKKLRP